MRPKYLVRNNFYKYAMLEINDVSKKYSYNGSDFVALNGVTLHVEKGEFVAIVGPSGSGKSTLLNVIGGLVRPDSGQALFRGEDIYSMAHRQTNRYRKKNVGFVFQQFHLIPYLTVFENIKLAGSSQLDKHLIEEYLERCALWGFRNKYPSELSVGEKQRTAFIRAIISKPDMLLADEPTGNLDPENSKNLMSLVTAFHKDGGTILLVSHQPETAGYADRIFKLCQGRIV
jgi:putative ABC transport system ATP-binding protein